MGIKIKTRNGYEFEVDDEDEQLAKEPGWFIHKDTHKSGARKYVIRHSYDGSKHSIQFLHRLIMDAPKGVYCDHVNGDGLDNRRENLRIATNSQNQANSKVKINNTSGYKGVSWNKHNRKWAAKIKVNGKWKSGGYFKTKEDAALAYNRIAIEYFGNFAKLNNLPPLARLSGTSPCAVQCED